MFVFVGTEVLPGDAAGAVLGRNATPEQLAELREQMGLDRPAAARYLDWLGGLVTGDLGNSASRLRGRGAHVPIWNEIEGPARQLAHARRSWPTVIMVPLSLLLGVAGGDPRRTLGRPRDLVHVARGRVASRSS